MSKIVWDDIGERFYEAGVDQGVLYLKNQMGLYTPGVAWNGIISVSENPTGAEPNPQFADNIKYLNLMSAEEFEATIEAFMYPPEFHKCDGSARPTGVPGVLLTQQPRSIFGFVYRTKIGNDVDGDTKGYKLHLVYEALAAPTDKSYQTVNDSPEALTFSWDITTTPIPFSEHSTLKPTAHLVVNSLTTPSNKLKALEDQLFGTASITPNLPLPDAVINYLT